MLPTKLDEHGLSPIQWLLRFFFLIRFPIIAEMLNRWMRLCPCVHFDSRGVVVRAYVKTDYCIKVVGGRHNPENTASARLARKTNFVCFFFFWPDLILLCITTTVCIYTFSSKINEDIIARPGETFKKCFLLQ